MGKKKPIVSSLGQWAYPGEVTIIPSNSITMKGVEYPVLGVDNLGNSQMMMPGADYTFPGDYVTEYPQMQFGGMSKRKIDKILNQNKDLNFVQRMYQPNTPSIIIPGQPYPATHFMESADGLVYPTVVQMPDGSLQYLGDNAYNYANQTGEYIEFPNDRQARRFAKNYKKGTGVLEEFGKGGLTQWFAEEWTDIKTGKPCGRSGKDKDGRPYPACRPKKRVNETTPKTTSEMSSAEKAKFKREKTSGKRIDYNHKRRQDGGQEDSTMENIAEFFDPTGYTSWDDANRAYNEWKKSNSTLPSMSQALDMFGAVPALGKLGKLKYLDPNSIKTAYKTIPWQQILNAFDTAEDEVSKTKKKYGGWLEQYQDGGESDIRMEPIQINTQQAPWYIRYPRKALRAIDNKLTDWGAQYSQRISDATGGKDWYKEANPFGSLALEFLNAPQYTATYGVTGKVQTPSEAMDIQNPYGAFAVDAITDPMNLVGAGVTRVPQYISNVGNSLLKKGVRAGLQSPRLSFAALQKRLPSSFEDVAISPGLEKRELIKPSANQQANLVEFMQGLAEEAPLIRQSLNRRIADLESPEGYKRLVNQEQEALLASGVDSSVAERLAKLQAKSRIEELKNTEIINESAVDYLNRPSFTADNPLVDEDFLYTNAYYLRPVDDMLSNLPKQPGSISLSKSAPINYAKPKPGTIGVGYNLKNAIPIHMHEIGHALQRGRSLPIDRELITTIKPRKKLNPVDKSQYDYFIGGDKLEPTAFANELREALLQKNFIQNTYDEITPEILSAAQKHFKKNPLGLYSPNDAGSFWSQTRILDFMEPSQSNFQNLSKIMNKLPAVAPIGIGAAGVAQLPEQKYGGWLDSYQDGGEKLPELNSKIDVANFYKNPLSNKYGIAFNPKTKGYEYYLKSQDVVDNIEPIQEKERTLEIPNISSKDLKDLNKKLNFLPGAQDYIEMTSPILNPEIRQRLAKEMLLDEVSSFSTDPITVEDPSLNIANQTLQELLKQEERSKPIPKYNSLPNKQKPIKAALNKNIELNPVQKYYADRMYEKYGKIIITDKATNTTFYGVRKPDGTWDLNNFEVLTGQNPNFNETSNLTVNDLDKFKDKRGTPIGVFDIEKANDIYGYPGIRLRNSGDIAYHVTYKGPDDLYRSALYNNSNILDNYRSYGCINCEKPSLEGLLKFANPNDKALIINSKLGFKNNLEWIKKNSPELYKELFKEKGGQTGWLNKYK